MGADAILVALVVIALLMIVLEFSVWAVIRRARLRLQARRRRIEELVRHIERKRRI